MDYQKILLIGNTTDAPKVHKPEEGLAYADFTVAVSRSRDGKTDFFPVRAFDRLANTVAKANKGTRLLVEGRVELDHYTPDNGQPQRTVRVLAHNLRFM